MQAILSYSDDMGFVKFVENSGNNINVFCSAHPGTPSSTEMADVLTPQIIASFQANMSDMTILDSESILDVAG